MADLDFGAYDALTFDCYGTLIDWERGILGALKPVLGGHGVSGGDEELLAVYARHEAELEAGPYLRYREVVAQTLRRMGEELGFEPTDEQAERFADAVGDWPAFPDSSDALKRLKSRYLLAVITNCDDDLFARSQQQLGVRFDWAITAEQVGSYKPSRRNFEAAFQAIDVPRERILHVAQSLFHDHVTAKELGMTTVWINRRGGREGAGATPPAEAQPDLELPDMQSLAERALG